MSLRQRKASYCVLTWAHIYAVAYYSNYLFFRLHDLYGFGSRENLLVAAWVGLLYVPASWYGGRFAQRRGYFTALKVGVGTLAVMLAFGVVCTGPLPELLVLSAWTLAVCFTWAPLEALVSESDTRPGVARMVGIYNVVWSSGAAVAYFTGGALQSALGPASLYWLPAAIHAAQWIAVACLQRSVGCNTVPAVGAVPAVPAVPSVGPQPVGPAEAQLFLRMAWLANPFAYVAMNTVIPLVPELAGRFGLSTTLAGFVASVWMFARLAAFAWLWHWTRWHYHFGWMVGAFLVMIASFLALLLAPGLAVLVVAQLAFGLAVGLLYYASLFYSMDVGAEAQGEHGGYHEMLIGIGLFLGPAVGAASGYIAPQMQRADALAVSFLLLSGLIALVALRRRANMAA